MTPQDDAFNKICDHAKKIGLLNGTCSILAWDQETFMPESAAAIRSEQIALMSGIAHNMKTDMQLYQNICTVFETEKNHLENATLDSATHRYIVALRMKRDFERAQLLPQRFVEHYAKATSIATMQWQKAKNEDNWAIFEPYLQTVVELTKEKGHYLTQGKADTDIYRVLVDEFEPQADILAIDTFFSTLKRELVPLANEIVRHQKEKRATPPEEPNGFSLQSQLHMSKEIISCIGYDWSKSRVDCSSHPFSIAMHPNDCRITIRSGAEEGIISQLMSALHEAGHSLYEMGLSADHFGTPLSEAISLSIHESQSRLWETIIGRSQEFMPHLQKVINNAGQCITQQDLYDRINWVERSFIRTEADEVTYPLHILLRYEIEKDLFNGSLSVQDIPTRWNQLMKELLGITPKNNRTGCLQDIHWSMGSFGYFPTYTLGSWYSICLFHAIEQENPSARLQIKNGSFAFLHQWLSKHVWSLGRRYLSHELVSKALKRPPEAIDYIKYLKQKYL